MSLNDTNTRREIEQQEQEGSENTSDDTNDDDEKNPSAGIIRSMSEAIEEEAATVVAQSTNSTAPDTKNAHDDINNNGNTEDNDKKKNGGHDQLQPVAEVKDTPLVTGGGGGAGSSRRATEGQPEAKRGGRREAGGNASSSMSWRRLLGMGQCRHETGDLVEAEWEGSGWWFVGYVAGLAEAAEGNSKGKKDMYRVVFEDGDEVETHGRLLRQLGPPGVCICVLYVMCQCAVCGVVFPPRSYWLTKASALAIVREFFAFCPNVGACKLDRKGRW